MTRRLTADEPELALEEAQNEALDRLAVARHAEELGLEPPMPADLPGLTERALGGYPGRSNRADRRDADEWPDDEPGLSPE